METPQNTIEELSMGLPRMPGFAVVVQVRKQVLDQ
jgi:hypothetical protein